MNVRAFTYIFLFLTGVIIINSCASRKLTRSDNLSKVFFPSPPDTARIQYLTSFSSSSDIEGKQSNFKKTIFGAEPIENIVKPFGIEIKNDKIYICDISLRALHIIDLQNNKFSIFQPRGEGTLKLPLNSFIDDDENLYIADGNRKQIVIFNKNGEYVNAFGKDGDYKPTDIFVYNDKIWVINVKGNSVDVYNKSLPNNYLYSFPGNDQKLYQPTNIFIKNDQVYINDFGDFKIKIYSLKGAFLGSVGSYGKSLGQFVRPKGIAVDNNMNLFVVDAGFENAQIFNKDGQLLMFFGGTYQRPGDMYLPAGITIEYEHRDYFQKYVSPEYELQYLILITNQYGPDKVSVYGAIKNK